MAVKTKDFTVEERDFTTGGSLNNAKGKNAIYIEDWDGSLDYIYSMEIDGDVLTVKLDATHSMSFENYQGLKYIKNGNGTLYNFIDAGKVQITDPVYPEGTKKNKNSKRHNIF